ncbi:fluoride efflux transporter CrcB [Paenibacillus sp. SYP-B3998]|uniref:Fluoride-specific ion channel FluC n=1 Tax=Paenibacillus sp. SYP-B3998 TaxID=2678564 RepID=A0A6G3ZTP0_9BACL|nr:fluoride efflux transporter CrcB [Paenibacillus sp. SYP-B3998]NEW05408.1 fluoride efflux transporter CrcB [Paenibacillus sp. SYP-B3998]
MLYIGFAGIFGALARYGLSLAWNPASPMAFPWGTLFCNFAGCLLLGFLAFAEGLAIPIRIRAAITTGFIGSFTTFSTFSYETFTMLKHGHLLLAALYVGGSLWGGLGFTWVGIRIAERFQGGGNPS